MNVILCLTDVLFLYYTLKTGSAFLSSELTLESINLTFANRVKRNISETLCGPPNKSPIINTTHGKVQGITKWTSDRNIPYYAYLGIPFAKSPVNKLRFKNPIPREPWVGILDASKYGNVCMQISLIAGSKGSEDCLFLNIFIPQTNKNKKLPVIFWVHGGGWIGGDASTYGPDFLLEKNVIVVSTNYRIGVLGFLSTQTKELPGNAGIKDVILALKWTKNNIENFDGDSNKITIYGESAGAALVHIMVLSPLTKGLFSAAIISSGTSLSQWALSYNHRKTFNNLAEKLKCTDEQLNNTIKNLQALPDKILVRNSVDFSDVLNLTPMSGFQYNPCVEVEHEDAVITQYPHEILRKGDFQKVPIIIGCNSREGLFANAQNYYLKIKPPLFEFFVDKNYSSKHVKINLKDRRKSVSRFSLNDTTDLLHNNFVGIVFLTTKQFIPYGLSVNNNRWTRNKIQEKIRNEYYPNSIFPDKEAVMDILSDVPFMNPIRETALLHGKYLPDTTYFYIFDFEGNLGYRSILLLTLHNISGTPHGEELGYIWKLKGQKQLLPDAKSKQVQDNMLTLFTNFAKTRNPTPELESKLNVQWYPVGKIKRSSKSLIYLHVNNTISVQINPNNKRMSFWDNIYARYGNNPYLSY